MCADNHHPFGLPTGLDCTGVGPNHPREYQGSSVSDDHDLSEQAAESGRG